MANKLYQFDDIFDVFSFGKHYGKNLFEVLLTNPTYLYWCINNIDNFSISTKVLQQIKEMFPSFIITESFGCHIHIHDVINTEENDDFTNNYDDEETELYDYDSYNYEEDTYEKYSGSYAQDVMGYSDDDIDTIFDGDPTAYWNID